MEQSPKTTFRLVTQADLDANPDLVTQGVSVNQMHDLPDLPEDKEDESVENKKSKKASSKKGK